MYCEQCGKEIPDDSTFCPFCGARQSSLPLSAGAPQSAGAEGSKGPTPVKESAPAGKGEQAPPPRKRGVGSVVKWIAAVVVVVMLLGLLASPTLLHSIPGLQGFLSPGSPLSTTGVPAQVLTPVPADLCGGRTLTWVNKNFAPEGKPAKLVSVAEEQGVYRLTLANSIGEEFPMYVTRDCILTYDKTYEMGPSLSGRPLKECGDRVLSYLNENFASDGNTFVPYSMEERHGLYRVSVTYLKEQASVYTNLDCTWLFGEGLDITVPYVEPPQAAPS